MNKARDLIWYRHPAKRWLDALPIGNGNIGAMVYGDTAKETVSFGESTMWSGCCDNQQNRDSGVYLDKIRQLIFDEKHCEADKMIVDKLNVLKYGHSNDPTYGTHMPAGKLKIHMHYENNADNYYRELDMSTGIVSLSYKKDGITYTRESFCSNPKQIFAYKFNCDKSQKISAEMHFENNEQKLGINDICDNETAICFTVLESQHASSMVGVNACVRIKVISDDGKTCCKNGVIRVEKAKGFLVYVSIETDFNGENPFRLTEKRINTVTRLSYEEVKAEHIKDHAKLYNRMYIEIGNTQTNDNISTDIRMQNFKNGENDLIIINKFYQFARYLLIASSRKNSKLPPSLQANWTDGIASHMPWADDFHIDINTQQNYWPSETGNLSECNSPLFDFIDKIVKNGRVTAEKTYHCSGWCSHITVNAWGCSPFNHNGGVTCGLWLISHMWEHYLYTNDTDFLKKRAYPVLKEAAEFFIDYLQEDKNTHYLVTNPAYSPENGFIDTESGKRICYTYGPAGDTILISELFNSLIKSSEILNIDYDFAQNLKRIKKRLPPLKVGQYGELMEWIKPYKEFEEGHRHTQHLLSIYPYSTITVEKTPELAKAAEISISRRLKTLFDTEWTRGNMMNFFARLKHGNKAFEQLRHECISWIQGESMMTVSTNDEPPFVMDGNTSCAAGIAEMIMQSHDGIIRLLPACADSFNTGKVHGICARGGFIIDMEWKNKKITKLNIISKSGLLVNIEGVYPYSIIDSSGKKVEFENNNNIVSFKTVINEKYSVLQ